MSAGFRDRHRTPPSGRDSLVPLFSSIEGMTAFTLTSEVTESPLDYASR
ncbi:hypothetical protein AB0B25_29570 [Nocardia sp. NPDC049190]